LSFEQSFVGEEPSATRKPLWNEIGPTPVKCAKDIQPPGTRQMRQTNIAGIKSAIMWASPIIAIAAITLIVAMAACSASATEATANNSTGNAAVPDFYKNFSSAVTVSVDGDYVVLKSNGVPDHKSPYFPKSSSQYEAYNGTNPKFNLAPNTISEQQLVMRIPITPVKQATPSATPLGPIGMALNGVAIFNQYAGGGQPLAGEIDTFDQYDGHPQQTGTYHYHAEPYYLTRASKEALVGVLLDGYPVYGPMENGKLITNADLDAAHGHTTPTKEFPNGIYHYHTTAAAPYINGSGFAGVPGTTTR
jgi:hypothetical protein